MGLADEFFWSLTPLLFGMLTEQYGKREQRENLRIGLLAAEFKNSNRTKSTDRYWTASDFFPEEPGSGKKVQSEQEMIRAMDAWVTRTSHRC